MDSSASSPTHLVDSFKSTLDGVRDADLLIHVVDISHPNFEEQIEVVNRTLADICDSATKPVIMVFNKIDAFSYTPKDADDLTPLPEPTCRSTTSRPPG